MSRLKWLPGQNIDRWDGFATDVGSLRGDMERLFSHLMVPGYDVEPGKSIYPSAELQDQGDHLSLKLEIPGMKPEEVDIQVSAESVSITGERQSETEIKENGRTRSEFHYGHFSRTMALPTPIKPKEVVATCDNGVLSLTLPKDEQEAHRLFKVKVKPS